MGNRRQRPVVGREVGQLPVGQEGDRAAGLVLRPHRALSSSVPHVRGRLPSGRRDRPDRVITDLSMAVASKATASTTPCSASPACTASPPPGDRVRLQRLARHRANLPPTTARPKRRPPRPERPKAPRDLSPASGGLLRYPSSASRRVQRAASGADPAGAAAGLKGKRKAARTPATFAGSASRSFLAWSEDRAWSYGFSV